MRTMRLFDKLASEGPTQVKKQIKGLGAEFCILTIDEIAKYYCSNDQLFWGPEDYPYAKSPWNRCFVEWNEPTEMLTEHGLEKRKKGDQGGAFVFSVEDEDRMRKVLASHGFGNARILQLLSNCEVMTMCSFFIYSRDLHRAVDLKTYEFWFQDSSGFVKSRAVTGFGMTRMLQKASRSEVERGIDSMAHRIALAFTFANCKNVTLEDTTAEQEPPPKIKRRLKIPETKRYTLNISGKSTSRKPSSDEPGQEGIMPWHLCRGHFATYTEEKPLFGKYTGKFWIPPHMKGKKERGEVIKDYSIKPQENPQ